jgi:hypothetical protein
VAGLRTSESVDTSSEMAVLTGRGRWTPRPKLPVLVLIRWAARGLAPGAGGFQIALIVSRRTPVAA